MEKNGCMIFDPEEFKQTTDGLQLAKCMYKGKTMPTEASEELISKQLELLVVADAHSCSCCGVQFTDLASQRSHFKLDWHRFNLKRQLAGFPTIREEAFDSIADKDDMESISGSESESEDDEKSVSNSGGAAASTSQSFVRHSKVFFRNGLGQVVSMYYCLLSSNKDPLADETDLVKKALEINESDSWAIIMLGGGHFAAGIFKGRESLVHKTFHCYTVRAKQGGSQSSKDNRGSGHSKSAGASLRRYNEQSLVQHVQDIISSWESSLKSCSLIFYRAVGPTNRSVLFGGKNPPLNKTDPRLRRIPFPTRRATYSEVLRVHSVLAFMEVHGLEEDFQDDFPPSPGRKSAAKKPENILSESSKNEGIDPESPSRRGRSHGKPVHNRAKSRPLPERPLPILKSCTSSESEAVSGSEFEMKFSSVQLNLVEDLQEFGNSFSRSGTSGKNEKSKLKVKSKVEIKGPMSSKTMSKAEKEKEEQMKALEEEKKLKTAQRKEKKAALAALRKQQEEEEAAKDPVVVFQRALESALLAGSCEGVQACLSPEFIESLPAPLPGGLKQVLNLPLTGGNTALHFASKSGLTDVISQLMIAGADPSMKNKKSQPPYVVATCKETKDSFTTFMISHPDLYDYTDSLIPLPLTEEQEREKAEKKAALLKAKRARDKEKRKTQAEHKAEKEEKERFLALSDREKRALAAEKRILAAQKRGAPDDKPLVLARCFTCAADITGKTPFEYEQYRFCTFECLKAHRMQSKNFK